MPAPDPLKSALEDLLTADEDTLLEKLGMRQIANTAQQPAVLQYDPVLTHDSQVMGALDDVRTLGRRLLARWSRELHKVMCGTAAADQKDRESLLKAIGVSDVAIASALTVLLIGWGVAAAVATVVAALLVKRIIGPAGDEFCKLWGEKLGTE
jgi:hypothetical protein